MPADSTAELQSALRHVLWIGGATDSGKTSVARELAAKHGLQEYHYDLYDRLAPPGHWSRIDPARHPHMHDQRVEDADWMWVDTTPKELVGRWHATTPERFELTLEDLQAFPSQPAIVAEGYGLTPDLIRPLLSSPRQAIWLVSTESFKRTSYAQRGKGTFEATRDPERARRNHIGRDLLLAEYLRERAQTLGLTVIDIDGTRSLDEVIELAEEHFGLGTNRGS